jgi:hypothetical protein
MIPQESLPEWLLESGLYEWLSGVSNHRLGLWIHACAAVVVFGSAIQALRFTRQHEQPVPIPPAPSPVVHPGLRRRLIRSTAWIFLSFQLMWAFLTGAALDRGISFVLTAPVWGLAALAFALVFWLLRVSARRWLAQSNRK